MRDLTELLKAERSSTTLDRAALDIARLEYPALNPEPWIAKLDNIAANIEAAAGPDADGFAFVQSANQHLFHELGLRGNEAEYYDVRNSCLNQVLERRLGIPITLSLIYLEVGRRLSRPVYGIALPSHFVVQYDDGDFDVYIDVFQQGELLSRAECGELVRSRIGEEPPASAFLAATPRQIALRMLHNLKGSYVRAGEFEKALQTVDLILSSPDVGPGEYKQRGIILLQLRRFRAAMMDLDKYLKLMPDATDRADVVSQIESIQRYLSTLN